MFYQVHFIMNSNMSIKTTLCNTLQGFAKSQEPKANNINKKIRNTFILNLWNVGTTQAQLIVGATQTWKCRHNTSMMKCGHSLSSTKWWHNEITTCSQIATLTSKKKTCKSFLKNKTKKTKTSNRETLPHWSCEVQVRCNQTITSNHNHDKCKCEDNQIVNILARTRQKLTNASMMEPIMISTITKCWFSL